MIHNAQGNLLQADVDALVNTVNTQGVMGKGIAAQFKRAYPNVFKSYSHACKAGEVRLGQMHVVDLGNLAGGPRWVINFPTKGHWKANSRLEDIRSGLKDLVRVIRELEIDSVALPPLGCGNGGLRWSEVKPMIQEELASIPEVRVELYAPDGAPAAEEMPNHTSKPALTLASASLVALVDRYRAGLLDPCVRLLEVHKLMYFLQEAGEHRLKLNYSAGPYGPYAENLRHVLAKIEGHWIWGYADGGDSPYKVIDLADGASEQAAEFIASEFSAAGRMQRVAALIEGYEDPYGLELLGTVHWLMCRSSEVRDDPEAAVTAVRGWNDRKASVMKPEHIKKAWSRLTEHRWSTESASALH